MTRARELVITTIAEDTSPRACILGEWGQRVLVAAYMPCSLEATGARYFPDNTGHATTCPIDR